jgi:hypothetical protein
MVFNGKRIKRLCKEKLRVGANIHGALAIVRRILTGRFFAGFFAVAGA